ncbi:MAG TPA: aldo/keto reductase [Armatimonadota bacterium]|jgi:predicted aldo/keto reductase-like oxidoreductase
MENEPLEQRAAQAPQPLSRREFVRRLTAATLGGGFVAGALAGCTLTATQQSEAEEALAGKLGSMPKRRLGTRMGKMEITPLVISQDWSPDLYAAGLDLGINYIHKAGYWRELPPELKRRSRDSYYCDITVDSTPRNPDDEDGAYNQVAESLSRNGLKYYDLFLAHFGWRSVESLKTQRGTRRAFERLKREGKVKYYGVSQHPWVPYPEILQAHIDMGEVDSIQLFLAYGTDADTLKAVERAHKAGIGIVAMKAFMMGRNKMREDSAMQARLKAPGKVGRSCLRYVLDLKGSDGKRIVDSCVTWLRNQDQLEDNLGAASTKPTLADGFALTA